MERFLNLVSEFLQRHLVILTAIGAPLLTVLLFVLGQRSIREGRKVEGEKSYNEAERKFEKAKRIEINDETDFMDIYREVINLCVYAINSHYKEAKVYYLRGQAYYERLEMASALEDFQMAVKRDKSHLPARYYLAQTYEDINDWGQAARHYERVLRIEPYNEYEKSLQDHAREKLGVISNRQEIMQQYRKRR